MQKQTWKPIAKIINENQRNNNYIEMHDATGAIIIITNKGTFEIIQKTDKEAISNHFYKTGYFNDETLLWITEDLNLDNSVFKSHI